MIEHDSRPLRVLHLPANTASLASATVRAQRRLGVDARGLVASPSPFQTRAGLRTFGLLARRQHPVAGAAKTAWWWAESARMVAWADVIHWYGGDTIAPWGIELRVARALRKPGIVEFMGSDIRQQELSTSDNPYLRQAVSDGTWPKSWDLLAARRRQAQFAALGWVAAANPEEMLRNVDSSLFAAVRPCRQRLVLRDYPVALPTDGERPIRIVHSPSNAAVKGTDQVKAAVAALSSRYPVELVINETKPRGEALATVAAADIFVDQLIVGSFGLAALEAMALGKPVVCYLSPSVAAACPPDLPIVNASADNLTAALESLICDAARRRELGLRGRQYVERWHDADKVATEILELYDLAREVRGRHPA